MIVNVLCGGDVCRDGVLQKTYALLLDELEHIDNIVVSKDRPAVVHVLGAWTPALTAMAKGYDKRHIPIVYTPLASLSPWNKPSTAQFTMAAMAELLVATGTMEQTLLAKLRATRLVLVENAIVTRQLTPTEMAQRYVDVYSHAIRSYDAHLWAEVDSKVQLLNESDSSIIALCRNILYGKALYERGAMPQTFLSDLAKQLYVLDCDESHCADVLALLGITTFMQRLEYVLQASAGLTEGFMPIPLLHDKTAHAMMKMIITE